MGPISRDVLREFNMGFFVFCRYTCIHFKQTVAIFFFHFSYNIRFLLNIPLILLDVHYFDTESNEKNQLLKEKCTKILFYLENRWRPFCILSFFI